MKPVQMQRVTSLIGKHRHESHLRAAIAIAERMNGIQDTQEVRGRYRKFVGAPVAEVAVGLQAAKCLP
ncbi:hypothetical protein SAMN05443254_110107 [Bradyrhizobium sp. OK095]|nr:hypothetical protein SAMN05443254_110107 [Bradyrhizobium sp. OK095]